MAAGCRPRDVLRDLRPGRTAIQGTRRLPRAIRGLDSRWSAVADGAPGRPQPSGIDRDPDTRGRELRPGHDEPAAVESADSWPGHGALSHRRAMDLRDDAAAAESHPEGPRPVGLGRDLRSLYARPGGDDRRRDLRRLD